MRPGGGRTARAPAAQSLQNTREAVSGELALTCACAREQECPARPALAWQGSVGNVGLGSQCSLLLSPRHCLDR